MTNYNYAHTPMFCNLRGKIKDLIWVNIHGDLVGYMNSNFFNNNFFSINVPKCINYLNCTVKVYMNNGDIMTRQNIAGGIGLSGDQSGLMTFGLGKNDLSSVNKVVLSTLNGNDIDLTKKIKLNDVMILNCQS